MAMEVRRSESHGARVGMGDNADQAEAMEICKVDANGEADSEAVQLKGQIRDWIVLD